MSFALLRPALAAAALLASAAAGPGPSAGDLRLLPPLLGTTEQHGSNALSGLGLGGHDPLSYVLGDAPRAGRAELELVWGGLAWRFGSRANRAAFLRDPHSFLPRIGGYDALAAADAHVVDASPFIFARHAGRLYLFRTEDGRRRFLAGGERAAAAAEAGWLRIRSGLVGS